MEIVNKDTLLKKVGENLRNIRKEKQMEIKEVVKKLKITPQAYGNIENGKVDLNMSRLVAIANVFEVGVEEILNATGDINNYTSTNNSGGYHVQQSKGYNVNHIGVVNMPDENLMEDFKKGMELMRSQMELLAGMLQKKK
jgi:transcriptional regulator with XRE-family HTH domain